MLKEEGRGKNEEGRRQKAEGRRQKAEGRRQKAEGRRQKAEGRRQKAEGRRQKAEGRRNKSDGFSVWRSHLQPQKPGLFVDLSLINKKTRRNRVSSPPCVNHENASEGDRTRNLRNPVYL